MKMLLLSFFLVSGLASAQSERNCSSKKLTCQLGSKHAATAFGGFMTHAPATTHNGFPCDMSLALENKGVFFIVNMNDHDFVAHIYNMKASNPGVKLPADAALEVVPGKRFNFRYGSDTLSCILK